MTLTLLRNRLIFRREKRDRKSFYPAFLAFCIFFACLFSIPSNAQDRDVYTLVVLGDSLSAGYGLADSESFPSKLEKALRGKGYDIDVINAGVSGDTTAGGLARLNWSVPNDADGVIVELGRMMPCAALIRTRPILIWRQSSANCKPKVKTSCWPECAPRPIWGLTMPTALTAFIPVWLKQQM
jgi:hypothetical protein